MIDQADTTQQALYPKIAIEYKESKSNKDNTIADAPIDEESSDCHDL